MSTKKLHDVKSIIARAKIALGVNTDTELARRLNLSQSTVSTWKMRGNLDLVAIIAECDESISIDWLVYGKGEMDAGEGGDITQRIITMLESMDSEQKRDVLRYVEKEQLLSELLREKGA